MQGGEILFNTLIHGSELALLAVGLTMVYAVSGFPNIIQLEFPTLGAYGVLLVAALLPFGLILQAVISIVLVSILALVLYKLVFVRLLRGGSAMAMIGSLALSIVLRAAVQSIAGPSPRQIDLPLERGVDVLGALVTPSQLRLVVISGVVLIVVGALLRVTPAGRAIRAVSTNPELAAAAGIDVGRVTNGVWMIAGALGALAGVLLAVDTQVGLRMGFDLILPVFAVTLLGGFGSVGGAVIAAYAFAGAEATILRVDWGQLIGSSSAFVPTNYSPAIGFLLLLAVLIIRPTGLLGRRAGNA